MEVEAKLYRPLGSRDVVLRSCTTYLPTSYKIYRCARQYLAGERNFVDLDHLPITAPGGRLCELCGGPEYGPPLGCHTP